MRDRNRQRAFTHRPTDYDVGYGKPPLATRFQAGVSGNPRGRPKGSKNRIPALHEERLKSIVIAEAYRSIKVDSPQGEITVSVAEAIIRSMAVAAAKGNTRAQRLFTDMLGKTEHANRALHSAYLEQAIEYKRDWTIAIADATARGIEPPDVTPHPDDIVIDVQAGTVEIRGPITTEQRDAWDHILTERRDCQRLHEDLKQKSSAARDPKRRELLDNVLARSTAQIAMYDDMIAKLGWRTDRPPRRSDANWMTNYS